MTTDRHWSLISFSCANLFRTYCFPLPVCSAEQKLSLPPLSFSTGQWIKPIWPTSESGPVGFFFFFSPHVKDGPSYSGTRSVLMSHLVGDLESRWSAWPRYSGTAIGLAVSIVIWSGKSLPRARDTPPARNFTAAQFPQVPSHSGSVSGFQTY